MGVTTQEVEAQFCSRSLNRLYNRNLSFKIRMVPVMGFVSRKNKAWPYRKTVVMYIIAEYVDND